MRLVEVLQITAGLIAAVASAFMAVEQLVVKRFRRVGATSPETAIEIAGLNPLTKWRLGRLISAGAVVATGDDRSYLDEAVYLVLRKRRGLVGVALVVFVFAFVVVVHSLLG